MWTTFYGQVQDYVLNKILRVNFQRNADPFHIWNCNQLQTSIKLSYQDCHLVVFDKKVPYHLCVGMYFIVSYLTIN